METVKLSKEIMVDGEAVKELNINFETLPSDALIRANRFLMQRNYMVANQATDCDFNAMLGGMAAGLAEEDAYRLSVKDKIKLSMKAQNFLYTDLEE